MKRHLHRLLICAAALFTTTVAAAAQPFPTVTILRSAPNGYLARVGNDTMVILNQRTTDNFGRIEIEHRALAAENEKLQAIITAYATADTVTEKLRSITSTYVTSLEQAVVDWRELAEDYKRLKSGTFASLEGAVGFSGDAKPAMLIGLGLGKLRIFGLIQESNLGAFAGAHVPIF